MVNEKICPFSSQRNDRSTKLDGTSSKEKSLTLLVTGMTQWLMETLPMIQVILEPIPLQNL